MSHVNYQLESAGRLMRNYFRGFHLLNLAFSESYFKWEPRRACLLQEIVLKFIRILST